jgi:branched-chain amino acid transport system substrate-binding protein
MLNKTLTLTAALLLSTSVYAQKKYDVGATDTEIKIGHIGPYSGPASAYGTIGKTINAYFNMINEKGGINGRKIKFITYDDGYSPPKAVEQTRKLVESDEVLLIFQPLGTANNTAIMKYMNEQKVPQLFVATGATKFSDHKNFPWTMGWQPNYQSEGRIYAGYIMTNKPDAKIGILFQNDDYGKDVLKGLKDGLGAKASMIVSEAAYEVTEPTIDAQIVKLQSSGANVFVNIATPKHAAQAIKKVAEIGWKLDINIVNNVSTSVGSVLKPAGLDNAKNIISANYAKDPTDPAFKTDPAIVSWTEFMKKYYPEGDVTSNFNVYGAAVSESLVQVLKQAGNNLTRENVVKEAANLKNFRVNLLLDGITMNTSPTDYSPIEQMQMQKFDGDRWIYFGPVIDGAVK